MCLNLEKIIPPITNAIFPKNPSTILSVKKIVEKVEIPPVDVPFKDKFSYITVNTKTMHLKIFKDHFLAVHKKNLVWRFDGR